MKINEGLPGVDRGTESTIVVDGVFFQHHTTTGIARLWKEILMQWQEAKIGHRIVLLDRGDSLPKFQKLRTISRPAFSYLHWQEDRQVVQEICDSLGADIFVSTYYTRPEHTPSVMLVHDMIPERLGFDLTGAMWQQKHEAIRYASAFAAISKNTLADLRTFFPETARKPVIVTLPGVSPWFFPPTVEERRSFHRQFVVPHLDGRPYFLFVSELSSYKNSQLLLRALQGMPLATLSSIGLLFTHIHESIARFRSLPGLKVHAAQLSDTGLRLAYGSALALVYPSHYEGFGLPALEAMACGCPVVCSNTSSIPEVVGNDALLVDPNNSEQLRAALLSLGDPVVRRRLRLSGLERAKNFSWEMMASQLGEFLMTGGSAPSHMSRARSATD